MNSFNVSYISFDSLSNVAPEVDVDGIQAGWSSGREASASGGGTAIEGYGSSAITESEGWELDAYLVEAEATNKATEMFAFTHFGDNVARHDGFMVSFDISDMEIQEARQGRRENKAGFSRTEIDDGAVGAEDEEIGCSHPRNSKHRFFILYRSLVEGK